MPGRVEWMALERAELERLARLEHPHACGRTGLRSLAQLTRSGTHQLALARADQHLQVGPALEQGADLAHVIEVVVREQHVRGL